MPALFVKPAMEGSSKGIYDFNKALSVDDLNSAAQKLRLRFPGQDLLVETFLSGREFTVSLLGTGDEASVLGSIEHAWAPDAGIDFWTHSIKEDEKTAGAEIDVAAKVDPKDPVVQAAEALALRTWRALGCRDGGRVDVRCQGSGEHAKPFVMEVSQACTSKNVPEGCNH
jgi:D-alanine-D-alanine ligase-like ATP-grasp enzyme